MRKNIKSRGNMEKASINNLSMEVIEQILDSKELSIRDVMNFKKTCKRFYQTEMGNKFWKRKFAQRLFI